MKEKLENGIMLRVLKDYGFGFWIGLNHERRKMIGS
jgi:hypothetical protein